MCLSGTGAATDFDSSNEISRARGSVFVVIVGLISKTSSTTTCNISDSRRASVILCVVSDACCKYCEIRKLTVKARTCSSRLEFVGKFISSAEQNSSKIVE